MLQTVCVIEHINHINQEEVLKAIRRMIGRGALPTVLSVTTDNGCEFLNQNKLEGLFKAKVYYTRAYASYEKGAIENCNRLIRRWYPKGTDFNALTRSQIRDLEDTINSIHRQSLNGETAYAYDSRLAKVAYAIFADPPPLQVTVRRILSNARVSSDASFRTGMTSRISGWRS